MANFLNRFMGSRPTEIVKHQPEIDGLGAPRIVITDYNLIGYDNNEMDPDEGRPAGRLWINFIYDNKEEHLVEKLNFIQTGFNKVTFQTLPQAGVEAVTCIGPTERRIGYGASFGIKPENFERFKLALSQMGTLLPKPERNESNLLKLGAGSSS